MPNVKNIIKKVKNLKPIPTIVHRILELAHDPEGSLKQLVELVAYEPALTANLIKTCNSAFFGLRVKIDSVQQAVTMLGQQQVVELVLTQNLSTNMARAQKGYQLEKGVLWRQSVASAMVARILSERRQLDNLPAIYTAALLKDIGKVILSEHVERMHLRIQRMVKKKGLSFLEAEQSCLGVDHAALGAIIAREWKFSDHMVFMIENHHMNNPEAHNDPATGAIYLADIVAMMVGTGIGVDRLAYHVYEAIFNDYFLARDELKALMYSYSGYMEGAKKMFEAA